MNLAPLFCGEKPRKLIQDAEGVSNFLRGRLLAFNIKSPFKALPPPFNGYSCLWVRLTVVN